MGYLANEFRSDIELVQDGDPVDAKSILGILLLAAGQGTRITVRCAGEDERRALDGIAALVASGFGEAD